MDYTVSLQSYLNEEIDIIHRLDLNAINQVLEVLEHARLKKKHIYVCGNGGSASTASHFASDFNKGVNADREFKYQVECLSDNVPMLMAIANDVNYDDIFRVPLQNKMEEGDILIGISGSGNSRNVVNAMEYAKSIGGITIALVGYDGGIMKTLSDYCIHIEVDNMQIVEDIHLIINHLMMSAICSKRNRKDL